MINIMDENMYCKFCKKRVCTAFGTITPTLIKHMENHHYDLLKDKYWEIPIPQVVDECFVKKSGGQHEKLRRV